MTTKSNYYFFTSLFFMMCQGRKRGKLLAKIHMPFGCAWGYLLLLPSKIDNIKVGNIKLRTAEKGRHMKKKKKIFTVHLNSVPCRNP